MDESLDIRVLQLLSSRRGEWKEIAVGSGVSYSWLSKYANGHIPNPGFGTLKRLHAYLSGAPAVPEQARDEA